MERHKFNGKVKFLTFKVATIKIFVEASDAIEFIQTKLSALTQKAAEGKSKAEQESILARSFDIWKKLSSTGAKMAIETIKDPLKGVSQFQEQIQEQMAQVGEDIGNRIEIDEWRGASKSDFKNIMESLDRVTSELSDLHKKVDLLSKKKKVDHVYCSIASS